MSLEVWIIPYFLYDYAICKFQQFLIYKLVGTDGCKWLDCVIEQCTIHNTERMSTLCTVNLFHILEIMQCTLALYIQFLPMLETFLNPTGGWPCRVHASFHECASL